MGTSEGLGLHTTVGELTGLMKGLGKSSVGSAFSFSAEMPDLKARYGLKTATQSTFDTLKLSTKPFAREYETGLEIKRFQQGTTLGTVSREKMRLFLVKGTQARLTFEELSREHPQKARALETGVKALDHVLTGVHYTTGAFQGGTAGAAMGSVFPGVGSVTGGIAGAIGGMGVVWVERTAFETAFDAMALGGDAVVDSCAANEMEREEFRKTKDFLLTVGTTAFGFKGKGKHEHTHKPLNVNEPPHTPLNFDYSTPHAPYSLPIHPIDRKGPWAIDTSVFTSGKPTKYGGIRNPEQFWKAWSERHPETLQGKNLHLAKDGKAPTIDGHWIQYFPEHQQYLGMLLEHHHVDQGPMAVPMPWVLHRGNGNYKIWHE